MMSRHVTGVRGCDGPEGSSVVAHPLLSQSMGGAITMQAVPYFVW